jgi:alpha-L-fucosidase
MVKRMLNRDRAGIRIATGWGLLSLLLAGSAAAQGYKPGQKFAAAEAKQAAMVDRVDARGPFHANWDSLGGYRIPEWFRNAKFGIFLHWGVYSVPAFGNEWYSRNMYVQGSPDYKHQIAEHGPESKFGYKDFIPEFRAEKFDPAAWADLFARAGARYVVPVAEHCDGFTMYDSKFTDWDAAKMGPHRDAVGELEKAVRARGLHFGVSSHRAEHWWWYHPGTLFDSDVREPRNAGIYGPAEPMTLPGGDDTKEPDPNHLERWLPPDRWYLRDWLSRSTELVDKYHPDFLYFDWWIGQPAFQPYLQKFAAYYYDRAAEWHKGVVLTYKEHAMPENTAVLDIERGKLDALRLLPWQTDTSISIKSWGYVKGDHYRDATSLIQELVDIVSKNGNLLLNVGPESDGTIPPEAQKTLLEIGQWLRVNGEAIYDSRPWLVYGEGPTKVVGTGKLGTDAQSFTWEDVRYTTRGGNLYAIALARPQGKLTLRSLMRGNPYLPGPVCSVQLVGSEAPVPWQQGADGLTLTLPAAAPEEAAYTFRIRSSGAGNCSAGRAGKQS